MTKEQKRIVSTYRSKGMGYGTIAKKAVFAVNTVKSYCRRMVTKGEKAPVEDTTEHRCLYCGVPIKQNPGRKKKKFCSDKCPEQVVDLPSGSRGPPCFP